MVRVQNLSSGYFYGDTLVSITTTAGTIHVVVPLHSCFARTFTATLQGEGHIGSSSSGPRATMPSPIVPLPMAPLIGCLQTSYPPY